MLYIVGLVGVCKAVLYEISDNTNQAVGMSCIGYAWGTGVVIGPLISGKSKIIQCYTNIPLTSSIRYIMPHLKKLGTFFTIAWEDIDVHCLILNMTSRIPLNSTLCRGRLQNIPCPLTSPMNYMRHFCQRQIFVSFNLVLVL